MRICVCPPVAPLLTSTVSENSYLDDISLPNQRPDLRNTSSCLYKFSEHYNPTHHSPKLIAGPLPSSSTAASPSLFSTHSIFPPQLLEDLVQAEGTKLSQ